MLQIYHSNRMEALVEELTRVTATPLADPFRPETIVLQNQGMARWVAQQLALRNGISARLEFPLPASFLWQVLEAWLPDAPDATLFGKGTLLWRICRHLPDLLGQSAFVSLDRYLADDSSGLKLFQLAERIADLFDQYLVFRPDLVLRWEQGAGEHWQALLWRALCADNGHAHRARLLVELESAMKRGGPGSGALPERVCLFGLSALAPVYVRILGALASHMPVHIFFLNPCREYWSDLVDERGQERRRARAQRAGLPDPTGLLDLGNPLLASLGHAGQVFLDQLLELGGEDLDRFVPPCGDKLLQLVQRDLLELIDPCEADGATVVSRDDCSIQLHSTHGPLREIQVLHDRLLDLFDRLEGLEPRDIIVMAPDIDRYAPYVEAVFGAAEASMRIPWSIADRRVAAEQPVLEAVKRLLELPRSRFEASELLSLMEVAAVRRRFGLDDEGLERIRTWVRESGVRWGEDGAMRADFGLPVEGANSWAFGLDRLFLGYVLPPDPDADPYAGVLPYQDVEGNEVVYLGTLQTFIEAIGTWRKRLASPRSLADWRSTVAELETAFFAFDDDEEALVQRVRDGLDELILQAAAAGFDRPLSLESLRALLRDLLESSSGAQRFLTGRVTFCNMVPMRSIPFRVLCLIGMNGTDFPRIQRPLSFDLMAQHPRRGDRSRRRDDRYLFLEALLSAREVLYLSWIGNDQRDNSVKVPSVVIDELTDYLRRGYRLRDGTDLIDHLLLRHPLQPFSCSYFDGSDRRVFSYARTWWDAARTRADSRIPPFFDTELGAPEEDLRTLDVEDLIHFLRNPARYFLTLRLGLRLPEEAEIPEDKEPFDADGLGRYQLRQLLLQGLLGGRNRTSILARARGEGSLPHGAPGERLFDEQLDEAVPYVRRLEGRLTGALEPIEVDLLLAGFRLQGQLGELRPTGLLDYRFGVLKAKDRLRVWVRHLVLNLLEPDGIEPRSTYVAMDQTLTLLPVEDPAELLTDLLTLRWKGLSRPLAFFPESALIWVENGYGSTFDQALSGDYNPAPELEDVAVRIAFRGRDPIDDAFEDTAVRILQPMLDHSETVKAENDG
ncbi:MAG: exodeoxyribonuclease V subunit gamma [Chromatiaceae bacterium]|nr:exodeoxyribonuclease V subunit gamma [Chromatiaceae bacterium]